ncbi:hypothetical protein AVEN_113893-1 [Araneus ventricosus]|uniref:Uncharacterized protein n=1 Tax=Araneus ventricosus TaxID=182803 RepID=A0A4Y2S9U0_ARAVE|nr:hypothetical protein AVEN_113893-1 [Araneus ventricosus]
MMKEFLTIVTLPRRLFLPQGFNSNSHAANEFDLVNFLGLWNFRDSANAVPATKNCAPQATAICGCGERQPSEVQWKVSVRGSLLRDQGIPSASSHSLNLALMRASNVPAIRNCSGTVKSVIKFLKKSAKRMDIFREKVKEHLPEVKWYNLKPMCKTRWLENHKALALDLQKVTLPSLKPLRN